MKSEMKAVVCFLFFLGAISALPSKQENDWTTFVKPKDLYVNVTNTGRGTRTGPNVRVIGGRETNPNEYPFQTAITIDGKSFCGGTLISRNYVLTAAHCCEGAKSFLLRLGAHDLRESDDAQLLLESTTYKVHERWNSGNLQNDICLIKLPKSVDYNDKIQPVTLGTKSKLNWSKATIVGWGKTSGIIGSISFVLRKADVSIIPNWKCSISFPGLIRSTNVCSCGFLLKGGCNGDSGGPLISDGVQVGITSFGAVLCSTLSPSVFTRVSEFADWISQNSDL